MNEVARLHATTLAGQLDATFSGVAKLSFHLAPPGVARPDPQTGQIRKIELGSWILPLFRLLAKFKFLRSTIFDPFGYTAERKMEHGLITEYEDLVEHMTQTLRSVPFVCTKVFDPWPPIPQLRLEEAE
jgi:indolepyruvate ferredoxin oxidoreductase